MKTNKLLERILEILNDQKGIDIKTIDLRSIVDFVDYAVVLSGTSSRHIASMAEILYTVLKHEGFPTYGIEGEEFGEWVIVDALDVVVHIFKPEIREMYDLEGLYKDIAEIKKAK